MLLQLFVAWRLEARRGNSRSPGGSRRIGWARPPSGAGVSGEADQAASRGASHLWHASGMLCPLCSVTVSCPEVSRRPGSCQCGRCAGGIGPVQVQRQARSKRYFCARRPRECARAGVRIPRERSRSRGSRRLVPDVVLRPVGLGRMTRGSRVGRETAATGAAAGSSRAELPPTWRVGPHLGYPGNADRFVLQGGRLKSRPLNREVHEALGGTSWRFPRGSGKERS